MIPGTLVRAAIQAASAMLVGLLAAGCASPGELRITPRDQPPDRVELAALDTNRVERALVRSEASRLPTEAERLFAAAREAYWNHETDAAVAGFRSLMARADHSQDPVYLQLLVIQCLEEAGRWPEAAAAYREFGLDQSWRAQSALAEALARQPATTEEFEAGIQAVPFDLARGQLVLAGAEINGKAGRFLLDTGFSRTLLAEAFACDAGVVPLDAGIQVTDAHGRNRPADMGVAGAVTLGGLTCRHLPVVLGDVRRLTRLVGAVDGVIGWDVLQRAELRFNFPATTLRIAAPSGARAAMPALAGRQTPLLTVISPEGHPLDLFLDTGHATEPATLVLHRNAGLLDSRVDTADFRRAGLPTLSQALHSWSIRWPRQSPHMTAWFDGWTFAFPRATVRREVSVHEGLAACDGVVGNAPFLKGTLMLNGRGRQAAFLAGPLTCDAPPARTRGAPRPEGG